MGASSSILKEQELSEFRKLNSTSDANTDLEIPTPPESRSVTDKKGFIIFGLLMLVLIPFLGYTLSKADINRLSHGYDSCGNLCGVVNAKIEGISCSGKDHTDKPYVRINVLTNEKRCTDECPPGYVKDDHNCYGGDAFEGNVTVETTDLWRESLDSWWKFIVVFLTTTILCTFTLLLFRYIPGVVVWGVTILSMAFAIALTAFFWYAFSQWEDKEGSKQGFLFLAILFTIFTVIICIIFLVLFRKIQLIIMLYKETTKIMFAIPLILLLPVITLLFQFMILVLMIITTTWMGTAAHLTKVESSGYYMYDRNGPMEFAIVFNLVVTVWALQFFSGCQYMVIAGSVAQWFFKKNQLSSPILISFTNTLRYHLGTIAFGSFILTLVAIIKALIKSLVSSSKLRWIVDCCFGNIEAILKFLSKNAYIETAIYGQSFFRSGKRAAKLLITNAGSVIAINSVGDFILAMTQFLLLIISTAIAYSLFSNNSYFWFPTTLSFFLNLIIVIIVFGVFETIVDSLFICFCEDMTLNDGMSRPYYMSTGLMQFVETSKKVYAKK